MSFPHGPEFPALGTITRARRSRGHPRPSCLLPTERGRGRECADGGRNWPLPGGLGSGGLGLGLPWGLRPQRTLRPASRSQGGFNQSKSGAGPVKRGTEGGADRPWVPGRLPASLAPVLTPALPGALAEKERRCRAPRPIGGGTIRNPGRLRLDAIYTLPSFLTLGPWLGWGTIGGCCASGGGLGRGFLEEATPRPSLCGADSPSSDEGDCEPLLSHAAPVAGPGPWGETEAARAEGPTQSSLSAGESWRLSLPAGLRGANES